MASKAKKQHKSERKWLNYLILDIDEVKTMTVKNTLVRFCLEAERCPDCQAKGFKIENLEMPVIATNPMCKKHEKKIFEFVEKYRRFIQ